MMPDYPLGETLYFKFTTRSFSTGAPTQLAGTPVLSVYENDNLTQITAGVTLDTDFDSVTGLNEAEIVATSGNGYESGKSYAVVITTGTVGGVSVVGEVVAQFSIERSPALRPTTAGRTLDVTATGAAGIDWGNVENPSTTVDLSATTVDAVDDVTGAVGSVTAAVTTGAISANAITSTAIQDGAIAAAKFGSGAITASAIAANAITSSELADGAITAAKIATTVAADVTAVSGSTTAADNLESQYDGSTGLSGDLYPATQLQVGNLTSGTAAINTVAESFTATTAGTPTNTYTATHQEDGTYHILPDSAGTTDCYYQFDVGGNGIPVSVTWVGYAQSNGDSYAIYAYNYGGTAYEQIGTISASNGTTPTTETFDLTNAHVGTGADLGKVRFRFESTDGTNFATDRLLCSYAVVSQSVGYADGAIWVDTNGSGATGTGTAYVDGVADNPVADWDAAINLSTTLGINRFRIAGGSSITLDTDSTAFQVIGNGDFTLALGAQTITNALFKNAQVSGTGSGTGVQFELCHFAAGASIPPGNYYQCGFKGTSGSPVTSSGASGEWVFYRCYSEVAGSGTPYFNWSGVTTTTGINVRGWNGGSDWTIDSNCTLSLEIEQGGGQTITTGGGSAEIRGICRALTVTMSSTETVQFVGVTGPITLSGTTTGTVNLYGVAESLSDSTSGATTTNNTVSRDNINAEVDDVISTDTFAELSAVPAANANLRAQLAWVFLMHRNKRTTTATTDTVRNDADDDTLGSSTISDSAGTFTRGEYS